MPMTSTCPNCLQQKTNYADYYCTTCQGAVNTIETKATSEKWDMGRYRREKEMALAGQRPHGNMGGKHNPGRPFSRIDDTALRARLGLD